MNGAYELYFENQVCVEILANNAPNLIEKL